MARILNGRAIGLRIRDKVKGRVARLERKPRLAVILVGDDPASHLYVSLKQKACEAAGIGFEKFLFPANEAEAVVVAKVEELNDRDDVTGILVQVPLPAQDATRVISRIHPNKDVDGFHRDNLRALAEGRPGIVSALALGILKLIDEAVREGAATPKTAAIVGSELFAEPLRYLFAEQGAFATRVDPDDAALGKKTREADAVVIAVGRPGMLTGEMVKPGAIVIDVGTTKIGMRVVGDVDAASVSEVAGAMSPVPGGAGPMTVAMLLLNILKAHELQRHE